uniref:Choline transporter-like protein 4 n=1 Tax=Angiostrongylus cantonensis TaxID=6313 RepID=A0A0K0DLM3_ANGCA
MRLQQQYVPTAPPEEVYCLPSSSPPPPPLPPRYPPPSWQGPSVASQSSKWSNHVSPSSYPAPPPQGQKFTKSTNRIRPVNHQGQNSFYGHNYEMVDKSRNIEHVSRFNVKSGKPKKMLNPQLHTERRCTDVLCCFLFLIFTAGWGLVAAIGELLVQTGFRWGDVERLILPTDSAGRRCGGSRGRSYNLTLGYLTTQPYLYYFDITKCISYSTAIGGCQTPQICVSKCPSKYFSYLQLQNPTVPLLDFYESVKTSLYCTEDVDKNSITNFVILRNYVRQKKCASYTVNSAPGML